MTDPKDLHDTYYANTPVFWRKVGDAILIFGTTMTATFAGMDGVQVRMSYRNERGASFDQLVFAAAEAKTVLLFEYQALSRVYFDRDLPAFQSIMGSFKDLSAGRTASK